MSGRKRIVQVSIIAGIMVLVVVLIVLLPLFASGSPVIPTLVVEAGAALTPEDFFERDPGGPVSFDGVAPDTAAIGDALVYLRVGGESGKMYMSLLRVGDTVPPAAKAVPATAARGQLPEPETLVADIVDATAVTVAYKEPPDMQTVGERSVTLVLTDAAGNIAEVTSVLTVLAAVSELTVEAGPETAVPDAAEFLETPEPSVELAEPIDPAWLLVPGRYPLTLLVDGIEIKTALRVADTVPPQGVPVDGTVWQGDEPDANAFVTDIEDLSSVTARFAIPPDTAVPGEFEVAIILEDAHGNRTELTARMTVRADTLVIEGAHDLTYFLGDKPAYRKGVTAVKRREGAEDVVMDVDVDSSAVNLTVPGSYPLTYRAADDFGNQTAKTVQVTVLDVTEERVYELADTLLAEITVPEMDIYQKAYAIYTWVTGHVSYTGSAEKDNLLLAAYLGFQNRQGDCYTFYSVSEVLLKRVGVECQRVDRIDGYVNHYWNLVNLGDGWYHFDTTPFTIPCDAFLFTDAQAEEYTRIQSQTVKNCYKFDKSLYPAVNTEPAPFARS